MAVLVVSGMLLLPMLSEAATIKSGENTTCDEEVNDDLYISGGTVTIKKPVYGDVNAVGGVVLLSDEASVERDLNVGGGQVWVNSTVGDDVHATGGMVTFSNEIGDDLFIFAGNAVVEGTVKGDVFVAGGTLSLNGLVEGSVHSVGGQFMPGENMHIMGDLDYTADEEVTLPSGAMVDGTTTYTPPAQSGAGAASVPSQVGFFSGFGAFLGWALPLLFLVSLVALFLWTLFVVFAAPLKTRDVADKLVAHPWKSLGCGVLFLIATPIVSLILLIIMITSPIGIFGFIIFGLGLMLAPALFAFFIGAKIMKLIYKKTDLTRRGHLVLASLVGAVIYSLVFLIPFLGPLVIFIGIIFTLGSLNLVVKPLIFKKRDWKKVSAPVEPTV